MIVDKSSVMADPNQLSGWQQFKGELGSLKSTMSGFKQSLTQSRFGRAAVTGAYGAWGIDVGFVNRGKHWTQTNKGFLGLRGIRAKTIKNFGARKFGLRTLGKALGPAMMAYGVVQGYKEGGVLGGAKAAALGTAEWAAFEVGMSALGLSAAATPLMAAAAAGYGAYAFADAARDYGRGLKKLEMGGPIVDQFGTVATTRQRSLQALQNTHINGRMALGNEALLMHTNVYSRR